MKLLETARKTAKKAVVAVVAAVRPAAAMSRDARDELARRAEVNAEAEARRADRARIFDEMAGGHGRWIPRRTGWLKGGR